MSLDLTLVPVEHEEDTWGYGHTILELGYDECLTCALHTAKTTKWDKDFRTYLASINNDEDTGYGNVLEDKYGEPLQYMTAESIVESLKSLTFRNPTNRAVHAYLMFSDPNLKIILFWR